MTKRVLGPGAKCCGEDCGVCDTEAVETVEAVAVVEADDELDWDDEEDA